MDEKQREREELALKWTLAKDRERAATEDRLLIESKIVDLINGDLPEKGTVHFESLSIQCGVTEKWDQEALAKAVKRWPSSRFPLPFDVELKPRNADIKVMRENFPDLWERLKGAFTTSPRKPSFTVSGGGKKGSGPDIASR